MVGALGFMADRIKLVLCVALLACGLSFAGASFSSAYAAEESEIEITFWPPSVSVPSKNPLQLEPTITPETAGDVELEWSSSDTSVATVDANGMVTPVALGKTTVTATIVGSEKSASVEVLVGQTVSAIESTPAELTLPIGETATIVHRLLPLWPVTDDPISKIDLGGCGWNAEGAGSLLGGKTWVDADGNPIFRFSREADFENDAWVYTVTALGEGAGTLITLNGWGDPLGKCAITIVPAKGSVEFEAKGDSNVAASVLTGGAAATEALAAKGANGLNLQVQKVEKLTQAAQGAVDALKTDGAQVAAMLSIEFVDDGGQAIEVNEAGTGHVFTVRMPLTSEMKALAADTLAVHYVGEDGKVEEKETWVEGGNLFFVTDHFSDYVVTGKKAPEGSGTGGDVETEPDEDAGDSKIEPDEDSENNATDSESSQKDELTAAAGGTLAATGDATASMSLIFGAVVCLTVIAAGIARRKTQR